MFGGGRAPILVLSKLNYNLRYFLPFSIHCVSFRPEYQERFGTEGSAGEHKRRKGEIFTCFHIVHRKSSRFL